MTTITKEHIGQKATFKGGKGIIRYVGEIALAKGVWVGIELAVPAGICYVGVGSRFVLSIFLLAKHFSSHLNATVTCAQNCTKLYTGLQMTFFDKQFPQRIQ